jgi:hypothetical protein
MISESNVLFSFGNNIKDATEIPLLIDMDTLVEKIKTDAEVERKTETVRKIYKISKEHYRNIKTTLPYFSCSSFGGKTRKFDHFEMAFGWVIDLDGQNLEDLALFKKCLSDPRVALAYESPSSFGIKLVFLFQEPMTDETYYTQAYKSFANQFALLYHLFSYIDQKNCDVSRVSFICHDSSCIYNKDYIAINPDDYKNELTKVLTKVEKDENLPTEVYSKIMYRLGTRPKPSQKQWYVSEELNNIVQPVREVLLKEQIEVKEVESIAYGIKVLLQHQNNKGEIIIYYGKRGYKVVTSPKQGTLPQLNDLARQIIETYLDNYETI